jgi:KaiC/GvpD/RAD55 family RecA-like ATPase
MSENEIFVRTCVPGLDDVIPGFPEGGLILVSGKPGSGKTIMGMTFIYRGALEAGERGVYVSVYEGRGRFLQLAKRLGMDFEKLEERGLFSHIWIPVTMEAGAAIAINMILERVESISAKRLVIDSFTALKQQFKDPGEARIFLQTLLSKIIENLKCTAMLIKEGEPLTGPLDFEEYVADAVIHLTRDYFEGRPLRHLEIMKLRGADFIFPWLICTIHKGLKVMPPTRFPKLEKLAQHVAPETWLPPDPPGAYTTGIPDLDREIGGYPQGSTILFEIDPKLTPWEYNLVIAPAITSFVLKGRHNLTIPSGGVSPDLVKEMNSYYGINEQLFLERFHIFYEKGALIKREQNIMELDPRNVEGSGRQIIEFSVKLVEDTGNPVIMNIGVDRIVRVAGEEALRPLFSAQDTVGQYRALMFWLVKPTMPWIVERLAPIADMHFKITREHGCVLLYGIKPRTPLYAIQLKPGKTPPTPDLIRIT